MSSRRHVYSPIYPPKKVCCCALLLSELQELLWTRKLWLLRAGWDFRFTFLRLVPFEEGEQGGGGERDADSVLSLTSGLITTWKGWDSRVLLLQFSKLLPEIFDSLKTKWRCISFVMSNLAPQLTNSVCLCELAFVEVGTTHICTQIQAAWSRFRL